MSKKLKRSAVALVLAATMLFSSQGVLTAFAAGGNKTSTAVDVSALEPILDKEKTDVANESGNVNDGPLENVCEICGGADGQHTEDCTVNQQPENTCPVCSGVDGQHEEGCSANQQPENTCPVCGGVDGQHTEDCTANQQPDEGDSGETTCPVCGGVDGQHTEDCTANQQPDEGDSGETTCPECSGVDGQHEENCSLAQKPDNTPSEEAAAAVQAVVDLINALPTTDDLANYTPTIELKPEDEGYQEAYQAALDTYYSQIKKDVEAARAAYDALTEEQKAAFDATVLAKLTALEELIAMREQADVLPNEDTVAMIGNDEYSSLNDAITAAPDNGIITLVKDCSLTSVQNLNGRSITIDGGSEKHHIDANGTHINVNGNLTFQNVSMDVYNTPQGHWMYFYLSQGSSLEFVNSTVTVDGSNAPNKCTVMYYPEPNQEAAHFTLDNSSFIASNCDGNGISWGGGAKDGFNTITVINGSTLDISHCAAKTIGGGGIIGTFEVTVKDSILKSHDNSSYGSNGSHFYFTNATVDFSNNETHGLSAGNLIVKDSIITAQNNGYYGVCATGVFYVDNASTLNVTGNSHGGDFAGLKLTSGVTDGLVETGATVNITGNYCSGLFNNGKCVFGDGVKLTITGNNNDKGTTSNGGGIYNSGASANLALPSNAVIYNNHADTAGDDIFNNTTSTITFGKVGEGWILDDTNLPITNWFYDGKKDGEDTNRWSVGNYYEVFTPGAITGLQAIKAAHQYSYNPGTDPTPDPDPDPDRPSRPNRDDDDDWEPLPDAPVKDKPTTEVDVPEETETPTTEQPDKYNPETGDTTTVFAAMALAAVSLGGVVLLGRKKK